MGTARWDMVSMGKQMQIWVDILEKRSSSVQEQRLWSVVEVAILSNGLVVTLLAVASDVWLVATSGVDTSN